ncbi:unnamed protein product [Fusarium oxysporum]|uniref:Uncharacterized protein n=1 Tax=Fusarium oxysporum TaxID=5507 RepID=A0A2H3TI29_FUSOX|nr:unnamed protein product [Fusarium oxysporum]
MSLTDVRLNTFLPSTYTARHRIFRPPLLHQILTLAVSLVRNVSPPPPPHSGQPACHDSNTSQQNPTITPLPSQITRYAVPLVSVALSWSSSRFSLLQYLLGLPPDGLEPLIVQAAAKGLDEFPFPPAWIHPSEQLPF